MKPKVGFMGLGIMGFRMAANILKGGYPLMVYNRTPDKSQELAQLGAGVASSPKVLAQAAEVIIAVVTGPEALNNLLWGPEGAAAALSEKKVFINMSSVAPRYTLELAEKLAPLRVTFIDAPVSGSKKPAEEATLIILAGGAEDRVATWTPLLGTMGKKVVYCGPHPQGSMMKMMINLLMGIMMEGLTEALNFGKVGGLNLETMLEVIFSGPMNCPIYQMKADMLREDSYPVNFPLKHMTKDLKFVVDTAYDTGAAVPLGAALLQVYRLGVTENLGDLDLAAVARVLAQLSRPWGF
jgi:3-hydroxyisobutyrate dehydrogenase-like beta-hydroxyacid dehydrogenase